jgi:outer membrane protein assembly factor BamB
MKRISVIFIIFLLLQTISAQHYDWPMWRYDAGRTASTPEQLADKLYLQWERTYSERTPVWDDPLNQNLMQFDRIFEPIVADNKIFIGFNDEDKIVALDINTGKELWHFFADGPVRMPLAANKGKIYFTGDDGYLYCLNANSGSLIWKKILAPATNKLLGNKRMISMWPARGGIVLKDNIIYTAASIFPMMGTFIYAINAETGETIWKNDGTGSNYILQPHRSPAFADVAPQGTFALSGNRLLVTGGRSVPAAFDAKTGEELYYQLAASGKTGGWFTCANEKVFFNHFRERKTFMFDSKNGNILKQDAGDYPVMDGDVIYFSGRNISAAMLNDSNKLVNVWKSDFKATTDLIKAGNSLFAADSTGITAIRIVDNKAEKLWSLQTGKQVERLVAANGKLIAVTIDGSILVYGDSPVEKVASIKTVTEPMKAKTAKTEKILASTAIKEGYAAVFGTADLNLLKTLVLKTSFNIIAFDKDSSRIGFLREYFNKYGIPSDKIAFMQYKDGKPSLPKYFSSLTIINDPVYLSDFEGNAITSIYECSRPYGGKIWIKTSSRQQTLAQMKIKELNLYGSEFFAGKGYSIVTRNGSLEGSANWTHNYGNIANTIKSDDELVKAPLGILWFGGNSNMDVLPRHGHGPCEQVIDGRLIIQGINSITARDVYTGRLLWKKVFENLKDDTWTIYYNESYDEDSPLDTKTNQVHLPGANARGTNFIVTKEYVYVIEGDKCHLLDINSGSEVKTFTSGDNGTKKFAYIGVYENYLILGNNFTEYPLVEKPADEKENKLFDNYDFTASKELIVMDRFTGGILWKLTANHGFIHNSVIAGDGILFCLDKLPQNLETRLRRRGEDIPSGSRLIYLEIKTGKVVHEETNNVFGTWLGYSAEHKLLLQATRPSRDMLNGESGTRMIVYKADTKGILWDKAVKYSNPPIISNDKIYTEGEGFYLKTGDPITEKDPVTGEDLVWKYKREYGCGYVIASEHLLTFRSAAAGFVNLDVFEGTGNLGGFKAGCSANLVVADGVLNSPDYTRTCSCPYQNQTSLAFINMPWMNYWTNSNYIWNGKQIKNIGLNFNAPGDRTSPENVLWIDFPNVGGAEPGFSIKMDTVDFFRIRKDPVSVAAEAAPWVTSSAIGGVRSLEISLSKEIVPETTYRVKLYFSELENKKAGERVFDVEIQGSKVLDNFDIMSEVGKTDREVIKSFAGVKAGNILRIKMNPEKGNTILSGIELIEEPVKLTYKEK